MKRYETLRELVQQEGCTAEQIIRELAEIFSVRRHEVAWLYMRDGQLRFLYPEELRLAGVIPLSSYSVAARTARGRRAELFNRFVQVKHSRVFEDVALGKPDPASAEAKAIQKLMSAPLIDNAENVLGVLQISRKGFDQASAGPDFSNDDLDRLRTVATIVAEVMPRLLAAPAPSLPQMRAAAGGPQGQGALA